MVKGYLDAPHGLTALREQLSAPLEVPWLQVLHDIAAKRKWPSAQHPARLGPLVAALSHQYNETAAHTDRGRPARSDDLYAARLGFSFVRDVPKASCAIAELLLSKRLRTDRAEPYRMLDLGAGLGAMSWGVARALYAGGHRLPLQTTLVDDDSMALELAREIAKRAPKEGAQVDIKRSIASDLFYQSNTGERLQESVAQVESEKHSDEFDKKVLRDKARYDLVVLGQVLVELKQPADETLRAEQHATRIEALLKHQVRHDGALVIVEPALRTTTRHLHRVRDILVKRQMVPFAPCMHQHGCQALRAENDWCHEDLSIDLPDWLAPVARSAGLRYQGLTFSYLILRPDQHTLVGGKTGVWRAVSSLVRTKGKSEILLCGTSEQHSWVKASRLDRDATDANHPWDLLQRGDLLKLDPAVLSDQVPVSATLDSPLLTHQPTPPPRNHRVTRDQSVRLTLPEGGALPRTGLYAIIDTVTLTRLGIEVIAFARAVFKAKPAIVQLRAKNCPSDTHLHLLQTLAPMAKEHGIAFFANDRVDLAVLAGCDGVHVGQADMPIAEVRRLAPGLLVGVSTHDVTQFSAALAQKPDYVAVGPVFETKSKENPDPTLGPELFVSLALTSTIPVVAIGGLTLSAAFHVQKAGALGAVIGALLPDNASSLEQTTARAIALQRAFAG